MIELVSPQQIYTQFATTVCRFEKKVCNLALHMFKATSVVLTRKSIKQENPDTSILVPPNYR
jgi:hypothetical protein